MIAVSLLLSGCISSNTSLFDPTKAITPVPIGEYALETLVYGGRTHSTVAVKLSGNEYHWKGVPPFRLFAIGDGLMVAQSEQKKADGQITGYLYDLVEFRNSAYFQYQVSCADVLNSAPTPEKNPIITMEGYVGLVCTFADQNQLVTSLRAAAKRLRPTARYYVLAE